MSFAILIALWSASAAVVETMNALNVAYDVTERRPGWKRALVSILYTLGLAVIFVLVASLMITGPAVLGWAAQYVGLGSVFITVWTWIRWPIAAFLLMVVAAIVYYAGPNLKQPFRLISPGAVLAVSVWILASLAFAFYVQSFADYNKTYGSMGAVVVLLLYFFLSAAVMLFGAEVNAVLARERGEPIEEGEGGR
jgi:membrane protein